MIIAYRTARLVRLAHRIEMMTWAALVTAAICAAAAASFARFTLAHLAEAQRMTGHQPPCDEPHGAGRALT